MLATPPNAETFRFFGKLTLLPPLCELHHGTARLHFMKDILPVR